MTAKAYVKDMLFGPEVTATRQVHLDYLRILAAILVILAHCCSPMVDLADVSWKRLALVCGLSIGLCCNLIYVMLSGNLLLSSTKEEKVSEFYLRRASKVIIPLIAYYMLLLVLGKEVSLLPPKNIVAAFKRIMLYNVPKNFLLTSSTPEASKRRLSQGCELVSIYHLSASAPYVSNAQKGSTALPSLLLILLPSLSSTRPLEMTRLNAHLSLTIVFIAWRV